MKKILATIFVVTISLGLFAEGEQFWSLVRPQDGFHYISIDQNLDTFSFDVLKYENGCINGHAGYFVYTDGLSGKELENYVKENGVAIAKNQGTVNVGSLNEGDKIGFYRTSGKSIDTGYIIGTKVVQHSTDWFGHTTETILDEGIFIDYISGNTYQSGDGGWMKIDISVTPSSSSSGGTGTPNGAPLPGALAVMFVGGIGATMIKKKK